MGAIVVSDIPATRLTHILYSFANIAADGTITLSDTWADEQITFAGDDTTAAVSTADIKSLPGLT